MPGMRRKSIYIIPDLFAPFDIGKERADIRLGVVIVLWVGRIAFVKHELSIVFAASVQVMGKLSF